VCLSARTLAPLTIQIDCEPVAPEQIGVASEGDGNWLDLTKRLGVLDSAIRQQVAEMINQHIRDSHHLRTIDVRRLIALSAAQRSGAGEPAPAAPRAGRKKAPRAGRTRSAL